jgi:hypothetical protein
MNNAPRNALTLLAAPALALCLGAGWGTHSASAQSISCGGSDTQSGGGSVVVCTPNETEPGSTLTSAPAGPLFQKRWGAIAVDGPAGKFGGVDGQTSKGAAEKGAKRECLANGGGKTCRIVISYVNQCGVMAWGDSQFTSASGPDINETADRAVRQCSQKTNNCKPYYAGCSYAQRIR